MWPDSHADSDDENAEGVTRAAIPQVAQKTDPRSGKQLDEDTFKKTMAGYATEVIPGKIFLGNKKNGTDPNQLNFQNYKITHIVLSESKKEIRENGKITQYDDIEYLNIDIDNQQGEALLAKVPDMVSFLESVQQVPNSKVLFFCTNAPSKNCSRSSAFLAAYLMSKERLSFSKALAKINKARKDQFQKKVEPISYFQRQLKTLERDLGNDK